MWIDFDHSVPEWEDVLVQGWPGMAERLKANWKDDPYHRSLQLTLDASIRLLHRLSSCAARRAKAFSDGSRERLRLEAEAAALENLTTHPPRTVYEVLMFIGGADGMGDGVIAGCLYPGSYTDQFLFRYLFGMDASHLEYALGQSTGLVKHHNAGTGQGFHVITALDQDALLAGSTYTAEKAERDGNNQGAGAADYQERQCADAPFFPVACDQRRHQEQQYRGDTYGRSVNAGKTGNEVFRRRFPFGSVFDELQHLCELIRTVTDKASDWSEGEWADFASSLGCDEQSAKEIIGAYTEIAEKCDGVPVSSAAEIELCVTFSDGTEITDSTSIYEIRGEYVSTELIDAASLLIQLIYF